MIYAMEARALERRIAMMAKMKSVNMAALDAPKVVERTYKVEDGIAHIPVSGVLSDTRFWLDELFGDGPTMTYSEMADAIIAAGDDGSVRTIQLDIDSPGGEVSGISKAIEAISLAKTAKPVHAQVGSMAASAAYWIASQANTIEADSQLSMLGSIGVATAIYKPEGLYEIASSAAPNKRPDASTPEGQAIIQKQLDDIHAIFAGNVAEGRGVNIEAVNADYGQGGIVLAEAAQAAGMIDSIRDMKTVAPVKEKSAVGGTQAAGPKVKKEGRMDYTIDQIKAEAPDVAAALRDEGAKDERARIMGLEAWTGINADCAKIVAEAKASGKRYEDVAAQLGAAAAKGKDAPAANGENAPAVTTAAASTASGAGDVLDEVDREAAALFGYDATVAKKFKEVK